MKIITADDNLLILDLIKRILLAEKFTVFSAENGTAAWELIQQHSPRIVITDWMMPDMDGIELCKKIRNAGFKDYIYIIIISGRTEKADAIDGLTAGADDYIHKPIDKDVLLAKIRSAQRILELEDERKKTNVKLLQSEKMASIGQLAAGVAHEINNPTGFVSSNLKTLSDYQQDLTSLISKYRGFIQMIKTIPAEETSPEKISAMISDIAEMENNIDIDFLLEDIGELIKDCRDGTERIKKIVIDLKDFAHPGEDKLQLADINLGIESTLNVIWNEIKYNSKVVKNFGQIPLVACYPHQLNQVFMNIIINAAQAITKNGTITISTKTNGQNAEILIQDTGCGIEKEHLDKIFDPFFTTKDVGKGTGLGMNVAYNIIQKHKGTIEVESEVGKGTRFIITLPLHQSLEKDQL